MVKKSNAREFTKNFNDINYFTDPSEDIDFMDDAFILLAENEKLFTHVFSHSKIKNIYPNIEKFIDSIYFTDQRTFIKE